MISLISLFLLLGMSTVSAASDADVIAQDMSIDDVSVIGDVDNNLNDVETLSEGEQTVPDDPDTSGDGDEGGEDSVEDSINTTIDAEDKEYTYGDTIKINFNLTDNDGNPINDTNKSNFKVYYMNATDEGDFNSTVGFSINNESQIVLNQLGVGEYLIKIQFLNSTIGDKNYTESNTTITLSVLENNTITFNDNINVDYQTQNITIPLSVSSNGSVLNVNSGDIVLNLTYYNGTGYNTVEITNDTFVFDGEEGVYNISFIYDVSLDDVKLTVIYANNTLNETTKTIAFIKDYNVIANDTIKVNNLTHNVTIPIRINQTDMVTYEVDGENITNVTVSNVTVIKDDLILLLTYDNGTENVTVPITDFDLIDEEGNYSISFITGLNFTADFYKANLTIIYKNGTLNETYKTINLKAFVDAKLITEVTENEYQYGQFRYRLVDGEDQPLTNCTVTVSGLTFFTISENGGVSTVNRLTSDDEGYLIFNNTFLHNDLMTGLVMMISYKFTTLPVGKFNVTFSSDGFVELNNKTEITVNKANAEIKAKNIVDEYGKLIQYVFQLVHAGTNEPIRIADVQFAIKATNIDAVKEGKTNLTGWYTSPYLNLTAGTYNLTLKSIDSNLICSAVKKTLTLNQRKVVLNASNRTIYYNSGYSAIVKLSDKKTGKAVANAYVMITVYTTSKKYTNFLGKTNKNGKIYLSSPLAVGKHKITFTCVDNNYNASSITRYLTVKKASAKFTAKKVTTYYRSGKNFQIKLTNTKNSKAIYYGTVNIKVYISKNKYYNLTGATDGNGIVKLKINYKPGTYKVVVSSADKGCTAKSITRQIKVTKAPIKIAPTALKVKKGKYFKVKVTSTKSKKVLSAVKVKVRVYTGKKYKTYTIKTNKKGIASLKIKQKVGKHKVVLTPYQTKYYTAKKVTKTLKVVK